MSDKHREMPYLIIFGACLVLSMTLVGCSQAASTPTLAPVFTPDTATQATAQTNGGVTASGVVVPARDAGLSFAQNGWVQSVEVEVGDQVEKGQLLAELEGRKRLEAAVIAAETEVLAAQLALDDLYDNLETSLASAYQDVIDANQSVGDAKRYLYYFDIPNHMQDLEALEALSVASGKLEQAREVYEPYKHKTEWDYWNRKKIAKEEEAAKDQLEWAQSDYSTALRRLELESALISAQANLDETIQEYEVLEDGPDPDEVAMAQARLRNTEASLAVARAALDQASMYAPFDGSAVAVELYEGETVLPGEVVITLGDLSDLQVETSDLSERDISQVAVGQTAKAFIEALGMEIDGQVVSIAPQAETIGGDVVYTVTIELGEQPDGLRWGMSVEVEIITK